MSQGIYTVATEPVAGEPYDNKKGSGRLVPWRLGLTEARSEAPDGLFELHKKEGNAPPSVGDQLDVERFISDEFDNQPRVRIKLVYGGKPSGSSGGGGGDDFARRPEHPRNEARMIHTSALSAAVPYIEQMLTLQLFPQPTTEQEYWALVSRVAKKLTASYQSPLGRVSGPPAAQTNGGEVPADTAGLAPAPAGVSDDVPF